MPASLPSVRSLSLCLRGNGSVTANVREIGRSFSRMNSEHPSLSLASCRRVSCLAAFGTVRSCMSSFSFATCHEKPLGARAQGCESKNYNCGRGHLLSLAIVPEASTYYSVFCPFCGCTCQNSPTFYYGRYGHNSCNNCGLGPVNRMLNFPRVTYPVRNSKMFVP